MQSGASQTNLAAVLDAAKLRVLRATVVIALLICVGNLVGAFASFTPSGDVTGPAVLLGVVWSILWAAAAGFPAATASLLAHWRVAALVLVVANALTVAVTGGIDTPLSAVCMYVGWIASVVVAARAAIVMSLLISASLLAGYLLAGASVAEILSGPYRYGALTNAALPLMAALIGVLLATVTNKLFCRLPETLDELRHGALATTPALTLLLAARVPLELPMTSLARSVAAEGRRPLTEAEREIVVLLAEGRTPKQIAYGRGVKESTVRSQIKSAKRKTGARTLPQLALFAD